MKNGNISHLFSTFLIFFKHILREKKKKGIILMKVQGSVTAEGKYRTQPSDLVKEQKRSVLQLQLKQVNKITNLVHYYHDMSKSKC